MQTTKPSTKGNALEAYALAQELPDLRSSEHSANILGAASRERRENLMFARDLLNGRERSSSSDPDGSDAGHPR
jgi:hypothetical protein